MRKRKTRNNSGDGAEHRLYGSIFDPGNLSAPASRDSGYPEAVLIEFP
jgi:hypothetical protein